MNNAGESSRVSSSDKNCAVRPALKVHLGRRRDEGVSAPPALDPRVARENRASVVHAAGQLVHGVSLADVDKGERIAHFAARIAAVEPVAQSQLSMIIGPARGSVAGACESGL